MNDQIVELRKPGLAILLYSPFATKELEERGDYSVHMPDGRDLIDHVNAGRLGALGTRFPQREHWLHFSATLDYGVIARASDHVRLGLEVCDQQVCVRGSDDLFKWKRRCREEQIITLEDGFYAVTACMVPYEGRGAVRIHLHFARAAALPDLGYDAVPELFCDSPVR